MFKRLVATGACVAALALAPAAHADTSASASVDAKAAVKTGLTVDGAAKPRKVCDGLFVSLLVSLGFNVERYHV